jgi:hypothetical protein
VTSHPHARPDDPSPGHPGGRARVPMDELAARRGVRPVTRLDDMAVDGLFDTDEDLAALQEQVRAWRRSDIA